MDLVSIPNVSSCLECSGFEGRGHLLGHCLFKFVKNDVKVLDKRKIRNIMTDTVLKVSLLGNYVQKVTVKVKYIGLDD